MKTEKQIRIEERLSELKIGWSWADAISEIGLHQNIIVEAMELLDLEKQIRLECVEEIEDWVVGQYPKGIGGCPVRAASPEERLLNKLGIKLTKMKSNIKKESDGKTR